MEETTTTVENTMEETTTTVQNTIEDTIDYSDSISGLQDSLDLSNMINSGLIFFVGMIFGLIFMMIFWDRFK